MQGQPTSDAPRRIPLRRRDGTIRAYAIVDAADYEWLARWRWCLTAGYASRNAWQDGKNHLVYMHREILGLKPGDPRQGDHENRDRLDCRRGNLRIAQRGKPDNMQNLASQVGTSRYRGVSWDKRRQKWQAQVMLDGKSHHLGRFTDEAAAAAAAAAFRAAHMPYSADASSL